MASVDPIYKTGTVSIEEGSRDAVFAGSLLTVNSKPGDLLVIDGFTAVIEEINNDNVNVVLAQEWAGATVDNAEFTLIHTGSAWHTTVTINEQLAWVVKRFSEGLPFTPQAVGPLSEKATYDDRPENFSFLAADQNPALWFVKLSNTTGDWSAGIEFVGPGGDDGLPGATLRYGNGVPSGGLGNVGDGYINYAVGAGNGDLYEKTGSTTWTLRTNIKGPEGDVTPEALAAQQAAEDAQAAAESAAGTATGAASSASASAIAAGNSANGADESAQAAAGSESAASASASSASGSAIAAGNSASAAATSAGEANDAKEAAETAQQAAEDARDLAEGYRDAARDVHISMQFSNSTVDEDPGSGHFRFNNATLSSVTMIFMDTATLNGADIAAWLNSWDDSTNLASRGEITFRDVADAENWVKFSINDENDAGTGYVKVNVEFVATGGVISNDAIFAVGFSRAGNKGLDGVGVGDVTGPAGATTNRVATFADSSGKVIKDSGILISAFALSASLSLVATSGAYADLSGKPTLGTAAALNSGTSAGNVPVLDGGGKISTNVLPESVIGAMKYQDVWNASTNTPTIPAAATGNTGHYYIVQTAGSTTIDGVNDWKVGDWIVSNGIKWSKIDSSDQVNSVAGLQGTITAPDLRTALNVADGADHTETVLTAAASISVGNSGSIGYINLHQGNATLPGYVGFHSPDGTRRGFVGWSDGDYLTLTSENGWNWRAYDFFVSTALQLGHATDTTITRSSAGRIAVEGNIVAFTSDFATKAERTRSRRTVSATTYTFALDDSGEIVSSTSSAATTWTIPPNSTVAFPVGTQIDLVNLGSFPISISPGSGVTLNSVGSKRRITDAYGAASILKISTDYWILFGGIAT